MTKNVMGSDPMTKSVMGSDPILEARNVTMRFGGLAAVKALTMNVPRRALRADRPERRRQDDGVQRAHGRVLPHRRRDSVRRRAPRRQEALRDHEAGRGADVSEHPPLCRHDRARERDDGAPPAEPPGAGRRRPRHGPAPPGRGRDAPPGDGTAEDFRPRSSGGRSGDRACRTAASAGWRLRARWRPSRSCCCSTSPPPA